MNQFKKALLFSLVLMGITSLTGCKEGPTPEELAQSALLKTLAGSWEIGSAQVDNLVVTNAFPGLIVNFQSKNTITVSGAVGNIWPSSSTFELVKVLDGYDLKRSDGVVLDIVSATQDELKISMTFSSAPGSRVSSVPGLYTFTFNR